MSHDIEYLTEAIQTWLVEGKLDADVLADSFTFSSPFWKEATKSEFLEKFLDPAEYIEKSLSNITGFDPIIHCVSRNKDFFTITLRYHTKNGCSVDEVVLCRVENGLVSKMKSIYDLEQTIKAHNL